VFDRLIAVQPDPVAFYDLAVAIEPVDRVRAVTREQDDPVLKWLAF
jgi:hypothetical protein